MEERLIRRAAIKYRQWMVEQSQNPPYTLKETTESRIAFAAEKMRQIQTWSQRFFRGYIPRIQHSLGKTGLQDVKHIGLLSSKPYENIATIMVPGLKTDIVNHLDTVVQIFKEIAKNKNKIIPLGLRETIEEISVITQTWKTMFKDNQLSVFIPKVFLSDGEEGVDLGDFWIHLNLTNPIEELTVTSTDEVSSANNYYHPHISDKELCTGDGEELMRVALCQGRLEDYFRIVEAILRTYNENSPHEHLREWYNPSHDGEFHCETCDEWRPDESEIWCNGCETQYCENCGSGGCYCAECGEWYCNECITGCTNCDTILCHNCMKSCENCHDNLCSSCTNECTLCQEVFCGTCVMPCDNCGDFVCEECLTECCRGCGRKLCSSCSEQDCGYLLKETNK